VSQLRIWLVGAVIACLMQAGAAVAAASFTPLAHSALVTLETASSASELTLRLQPTRGGALAVSNLAVAIDGQSAAVTRRGDDTWSVAWPPASGARGGKLEVVVSHDGISEVLSGTLPPAAAGATAAGAAGAAAAAAAADAGHISLLRDHKQLAWWILNITVVLIAVVAISRRAS
jgi:hypothetical protein